MIQDYRIANIEENAKFSIMVPSWNNLDLLKLCLHSIRKNSSFNHQVIVHVNEGTDGTIEWVRDQPELSYSYTDKNVGVCYALNAMRSLVKLPYMVYVNDDMYVLPDWDKCFWEKINERKDDLFFYSATSLEPRFTNNNSVIAPFDYGSSAEDFREADLLAAYNNEEKADWSGATWPPNVVATRVWDLVGGYSTEFSPGMYSDPDFSKKLWDIGVRDFRGLANSRAYHFMSKSVDRVVRNNGSKQFLLKWGMTSSMFVKFYLRRGAEYTGELKNPELTSKLKKKRLLSKVKKAISF